MLTPRVVKLGGNELDRPGWLQACALALAASPAPTVVVHGGGQAVSALSRRLELPVVKRDGRRISTKGVAEVVEMVLGGPVNRQVVEALRAAGLDPIGLSGVDGGLLTAEPLPGDLGHVGRITAVRTALLEQLLRAGFTPVVAPMAPGPDGGVPLNVNADDAAAAIAGALHAAELLQVSDVPGIAIDGTTQPAVSWSEIGGLIDRGVITDGMVVKVRAAAAALSGGAGAVRIGGLEMLADPAAGTRILHALPQPA
jgi:acetylglutamate kinase